jgi:hypothetical protein
VVVVVGSNVDFSVIGFGLFWFGLFVCLRAWRINLAFGGEAQLVGSFLFELWIEWLGCFVLFGYRWKERTEELLLLPYRATIGVEVRACWLSSCMGS